MYILFTGAYMYLLLENTIESREITSMYPSKVGQTQSTMSHILLAMVKWFQMFRIQYHQHFIANDFDVT